MVVFQYKGIESGQVRRQGEIREQTIFGNQRAQIRHPARNGTLDERIETDIEKAKIRQRARKSEVDESVGLQIERIQILSRFQTFHAADVSAAGFEVCQSEQVLFGQQPGWFL